MRTFSLIELTEAGNDIFEGRMSVIRRVEMPSAKEVYADVARLEAPIVYIDNSDCVRILPFLRFSHPISIMPGKTETYLCRQV